MKYLALALCGLSAYAATVTEVRVPDGGIQPQAAVSTDGILHLVYYKGEARGGDLFYVTSRDFGKTFSTPIAVNSEPGSAISAGTIRGAQIALGRNGMVHVAWNGSPMAKTKGTVNPESGKPGEAMFYTRLVSGHFEPQRNLMLHTFGLDGGGTLAADSDGNVYVAWHGKAPGAAEGEAGRQVWIAKSSDDGKTFAAEAPAWKQATGACGCCGMKLFANSDGKLYGLYRSATQSVHRDVYLLTSSDHGSTFTGAMLQKWDINACPMSSMDLASTPGTVYGAWETAGQVYFSRLAPTASAISPAGEAKGRKHPRIAVDSNGNVLMAWTEGTSFGKGGSLAWQIFDARGTATSEHNREPGIPANSFPAVAAKPDGNYLLIY